MFERTSLETDKDNLKAAKTHQRKIIVKKKKSSFAEEIVQKRKKPKGL